MQWNTYRLLYSKCLFFTTIFQLLVAQCAVSLGHMSCAVTNVQFYALGWWCLNYIYVWCVCNCVCTITIYIYYTQAIDIFIVLHGFYQVSDKFWLSVVMSFPLKLEYSKYNLNMIWIFIILLHLEKIPKNVIFTAECYQTKYIISDGNDSVMEAFWHFGGKKGQKSSVKHLCLLLYICRRTN